MMIVKLDREEFRLWLKYNDDTTVGRPIDSDHCPIAMYVVNKLSRRVLVDGGHIWDRGRSQKLPSWAKQFILAVDSCPGDSIDAKKCLELLAEIP